MGVHNAGQRPRRKRPASLASRLDAVPTWRDASPFVRAQLVGLTAAILIAFSAVTVDALTGRGRVAAQGTLGQTKQPAEREQAIATAPRSRAASPAPAPALAQAPTRAGRPAPPRVVPRREGRDSPPPTVRGPEPGGRRAPARRAPGVLTSAPATVAVTYPVSSTIAAVSASLGLRESPGDAADQARSVAQWMNANGGAGGRSVHLRLIPYDPAAGIDFAAAFAPACAAADAISPRPVAVIAPLQQPDVQARCLASHQLVLVGDGPAPGDGVLFSRGDGSLFAPGSMALDRVAREQTAALRTEGFLKRGSRVGIVRIDAPEFERASRTELRPGVAAAGAKVVAEALVVRPSAVGDAPAVRAGIQSAVLQLRATSADRVLVLDSGVISPLLMRAAEALAYRPRYGLNSTMAPGMLAGQVPRAQLRGAVGIGYVPLLDVSADREPQATPSRRLCEDIYRAADVDVGGRTVAGRYSAIARCGQLLTIRAALSGTTSSSAAALSAALERLGAAPATLALASRLDRGRRDGAAAIRALAFDAGCACMRYVGDAREVR